MVQMESKREARPHDNSQQTLSVCMIVRDEAHNLPQCLENIRHVASEIVVVDTGSEDDTVEAVAQGAAGTRGVFDDCLSQGMCMTVAAVGNDEVGILTVPVGNVMTQVCQQGSEFPELFTVAILFQQFQCEPAAVGRIVDLHQVLNLQQRLLDRLVQ